MSTDSSKTPKYNRRQWLKGSGTVLGASLLPISISKTASAAEATATKVGTAKSIGRFLTPAEYEFVDELAEMIIPADGHSGGAKAAQVVTYVDQMLRETVEESRRIDFREGLRLLDAMIRHRSGKSFVASSPEERTAILTVLSNNISSDLPEALFFREIRQLTIRGYYTSKIGIHDDLDYRGNTMIDEFVGCDDPPEAHKT
jgi:Gluconate 2-dehydrogenase subunit 3